MPDEKDIPKFIEDVPHFEALYRLRSMVDEVTSSITGLSQGHDVPQRALDLLSSIEELHEEAKLLLIEEDEAEDED